MTSLQDNFFHSDEMWWRETMLEVHQHFVDCGVNLQDLRMHMAPEHISDIFAQVIEETQKACGFE